MGKEDLMESNEQFLDFLDDIINQDKKAWDQFVEKYGNIIYSYINRTLKRYHYSFQNDEIEEIFDRIFVALLDRDCRRLRNFRGENERSFVAYLREISFHLTIDFLREQKSFVDLEEIQYRISDDNKFKKIETKDLKKLINELKDGLSERHHYLFRLIYEEDLSLSNIAEIMALKINAVHQLKFRMVNNLVKIAKKKNLYEELKSFISDG
ncbi:MAG: RNA polymerase sigma factor [bacterium]